MKEIIKLSMILLLVTVVASAALSLVNNITKPRIEEQKRLVTERALLAALPTADKNAIEPVTIRDTLKYYIGYTDTAKSAIAGYAFVARGAGYSSVIETMVGVDSTGQIIGIKIMQQVETPGLGTKIEETKYGEDSPWFQRSFIAKHAETVAVKQDKGEIESVTGATISSRTVANSISSGSKKLADQIGGYKPRSQ